jgi:MoaA/NifB/PqqE/SkfB family radical SAM enzyme
MGPAACAYQIDLLGAPLLVSWQITRNCDLACVHCCTESAPGKRLPDELDAAAASRIADELIRAEVPYVMLCGGEPLLAPYFMELAEQLGHAGIQLKIETNGQSFDAAIAERLAALPIRSIQVSLDADDQATYARQRAGGSLEKVHAACKAVREAGLPLEVTFAPTRINIHQVHRVIDRAVSLGAFRFNTGRLMRIGTAARHWERLNPQGYDELLPVLRRHKQRLAGIMDLSYEPFSIGQALRGALLDPPATLLILPNGLVKVVAALPYTCADLRHDTLAEAWESYRSAWRDDTILRAVRNAITDESSHALANTWQPLNAVSIPSPMETL